MDKEACLDWVCSLDTDNLIALANDWGNEIAAKLTSEGSSSLQTFEEYLIDYYSENIVPAREAAIYDDLKGVDYE